MTDTTSTAGPSLEGPAVVLCTKCHKSPRARKSASWCKQCYNEAAALYRLRARRRPTSEERECAWRDCTQMFTWRSTHPKQVCCSRPCYGKYAWWSSRPESELLSPECKRCFKCDEVKHKLEFTPKEFARREGAGQCRTCWNEYTANWQRANKDRRSAASRKARAARLLRQYQAPSDDINVLIAEQGGRCASCGGLPGLKSFAIDHDHETNLYRGLLCGNCNLAIGNLGDDIGRIVGAIVYILKARGVLLDPQRFLDVVELAAVTA